MSEQIKVFTQSSIRITDGKTIYSDPFRMEEEPHDADIILITHDHFDHWSTEDIAKVIKKETILIVPEKIADRAREVGAAQLITVKPGEKLTAAGISMETVPAYNVGKEFHPKSDGWVGYILTIDGTRIYLAGDTDPNPENEKVSCDIACVPIGGYYTMDAREAAKFVNELKPKKVIPIHYGTIVGKYSDAEVFRSLIDPSIGVEIQLGK
jgi:L-ascorbate metabolism protein UlaG (beta-lactamase superfamily)